MNCNVCVGFHFVRVNFFEFYCVRGFEGLYGGWEIYIHARELLMSPFGTLVILLLSRFSFLREFERIFEPMRICLVLRCLDIGNWLFLNLGGL